MTRTNSSSSSGGLVVALLVMLFLAFAFWTLVANPTPMPAAVVPTHAPSPADVTFQAHVSDDEQEKVRIALVAQAELSAQQTATALQTQRHAESLAQERAAAAATSTAIVSDAERQAAALEQQARATATSMAAATKTAFDLAAEEERIYQERLLAEAAATATVGAVNARATAIPLTMTATANETANLQRQMDRIDRRQRLLDDLKFYGGIIIIVVASLGLIFGLATVLFNASVQDLPDGTTRLPAWLNWLVGMTVVDRHKTTTPVTSTWMGRTSAPPTADPRVQAEQNRRADTIRLVQAAGGRRNGARRRDLAGADAGFGPSDLMLLEPESLGEVVDHRLVAQSEKDWRRALTEPDR